MASPPRMAAVGWLAGRDLSVLSQAFRRAYQIYEDSDFGEMLARIDVAERDCRRKAGWAACSG